LRSIFAKFGLLVGDVRPLHLADFDQQFDAPTVEVAELQPDEIVVVAVRLVDFRALVPTEFGDERA
jgi:hypothetical protein